MTDSIPEKIVHSTLLQAVARVSMAVTLPLLLLGVGYVAALGSAINAHSTDIALLQKDAGQTAQRMDADDAQTRAMLDLLNALSINAATIKTDVGYLRDWIEELKRRERNDP